MIGKRKRMAKLFAVIALCLVCTATVSAETDFSIDRWVIAGGGAIESTGGDWTVSGTIGQWGATEARALAGGPWRITGGFWGLSLAELADLIFRDRFEAYNLNASLIIGSTAQLQSEHQQH